MSPYSNARDARSAASGTDPANVGLAAALAGGMIVFLLFYVGLFSGNLPWQRTHEVHFVFSSANDLVRNADVRVAGVHIGKVTKVEPGPGSTALVTASIEDPGLPIHKDATAKIRPRLFLEGNFFIDVRPGSPNAPDLPEGGTIPLSQTAVPVQLDQLASVARKDIRQTLKGTVRELVDAASGDVPARLGALVDDLPPLARDMAFIGEAGTGTMPHDLSEALDNVGRTLRAVARDKPALANLVDSFARGSAALASEQTALRASVRELDRFSTAAPAILTRLNASFPAIRQTVSDLRPVLRAAPPALTAATPAVHQLRLALRPAELPGLTTELRPVVRSLSGFTPIGTDVFKAIADPVSCVRKLALPVLQAKIDDPPHSTGEPVYRDLLYAFVGLASANQSFDGGGHTTRYYGTFNDESFATQTPFGTVVAAPESPLLGSRPKFLGRAPAFHPEVSCTTQEVPDLKAETGAPDLKPTGRKVQVPGAVRRLIEMGGTSQQIQARLKRALLKEADRVSALVRKRGLAGAIRDAKRQKADAR